MTIGLISTLILSALPVYPAVGPARNAGGGRSVLFAAATVPGKQQTPSQQQTANATRPGKNGKIAFASNANNNYDIYTIEANGTNRTQLTTNPANDYDPTWSPNGDLLAFLSDRDGNLEVYSMKADGTLQTRLTNSTADEFDPSWSPDGTKIVFTRRIGDEEDIFVMNANGSAQVNLTNSATDDAFPAWTPDGRIVFTSDRSGNADIFVMNVDGSNATNLTNNQANDEFAAWSPDNRKIAFASDRNGTFDIFVMDTNGANQTRLTNSPREETFPNFSADSTKITYAVGDLTDDRYTNGDIYVMNADGSLQTNASNAVPDEVLPDWQRLFVDLVPPFLNPIDDPQVFVRQQYLDFLNREPDAGGMAYWTERITSCGSDGLCVNRRRVEVSAAFFVEQEFQQTGFYLLRFTKASLGVRETYAQFIADRPKLRIGSTLEADKQAFAEEFVQRPEFVAKYGSASTCPAFTDALITTVKQGSGVDLTPRRSDLINECNTYANAGPPQRARVVRKLIEYPEFIQAEYNPSFVLAQYFGYLRREADESGYQFWLDVLNNRVPGNYLAMVCAFITSREYQLRFGTVITRSNLDCGSL